MSLSKSLVLYQYILHELGYDSDEKLRDEFAHKLPGDDNASCSNFANALLGNQKRIENERIERYDSAIAGYEMQLRQHRAEPRLQFKYYQWFALLFAEYYLDHLSQNPDALLQALNQFKKHRAEFKDLSDYSSDDLKKLAFWMATGSGKTLLMHCNIWQMRKYFKTWENIILITPNAGMSAQHLHELKESGFDAHIYAGSEASLKTREGEVLIIEITKLVRDKEGDGLSVDVDYFAEDKNLVLIDEGHKGQQSEEKAWKKLREYITRGANSFTLEYSATFGQIIGPKTKDLLNEYGKAIVFDYSYRHFYGDGYGKDFSVFNVDLKKKEGYDAHELRLLLTGSLLGFYEQLVLFEEHAEALRPYNIEKPLWVFVGSKVIGSGKSALTASDKQNISDVTLVVEFFRNILADPIGLQADMDCILDGNSQMSLLDGDDVFKSRFEYLRLHRPIAASVLDTVFHGAGQIEAHQIKQGDGEIGLKTHTGGYFGVINIGDVSKYSKKLEEDVKGQISIGQDKFSRSLFQDIDRGSSKINILIGSKKFVEGWNSWRVSSMGLMNLGVNEGTQIIQLFGRGVRLKGKDYSLKREPASAAYFLRTLQTISIFGLHATYMSSFLNQINKETPDYQDIRVSIRFNRQEAWENKIVTLSKDTSEHFRDFPIVLKHEDRVLRRVRIDLRNKVSVAAGGFNNQVAEPEANWGVNVLTRYAQFVDFEDLHRECLRHKSLKGYTNLYISKAVLEEIVLHGNHTVVCSEGQFQIEHALNGKIQSIAVNLLKDYINKFYSDREKDFVTKHLKYGVVNTGDKSFPKNHEVVFKVPKDNQPLIEKITQEVDRLYTDNFHEIPTLHFDNHLYLPIASYKGKKGQAVKTIPTKLNEGETEFVTHLRALVYGRRSTFEGKEVYLLRNLPPDGIGFFMESSSFFPDFVLWVVNGNRQDIFFLDPKGIRYQGNFKDDKIVFCSETMPEINAALAAKSSTNAGERDIRLHAYILSISKFVEIQDSWGNRDAEVADFTANHVLFLEEKKDYLLHLFRIAGIEFARS